MSAPPSRAPSSRTAPPSRAPSSRTAPPSRAPSSRTAAGRALAGVEADIVDCRRCPRLVAWREQVAATPRASFAGQHYWGRPVPGLGDPGARVVLVGLAPAAHGANRTGRMFTGDRAGDWLFASLWRTGFASQPESVAANDGLALSDVWITAAVHCAPPDNRPTPAERDTCAGFLRRELDALGTAPVLVALGGFALAALSAVLDLRPRPRFGHLAEHSLADGRTVLCSYHPSQQNTFTGRLTEPMLDAVFLRARTLAGLPEVTPGAAASD